MAKLAVHDIKGKETGSVELPDEIFGGKVNEALLHQAVVMYLANQRQGNASTKTRGEVSGGGKKPWRQKGTGRARAGSSRSPLWHKGGIVFGPHPREYAYALPKKTRVAALRASLNAKFQAKELLCLEDIQLAKPKTKEVAAILKNFKLRGKVLALFDGTEGGVTLASRNIPFLSLTRASDINAYDVLKNKTVLVTKSAIENLLKRIQ
ncbi:MAG: 50S ribosomal protein L4 [Candidatus Omnitrophica bacterium]|nr:50S ribosomal protein L4 [Candidatus Omnitrophota bacterium]